MQTVAACSSFVAGQLFSISLILWAVKPLSFTHPCCNKTPCKRMQWTGRNHLFFSCQSAKGLSKDTVLHVLFQADHLTGQMESAFSPLPAHCGSRPVEQLRFESFGGFSPVHGPRPSWYLCVPATQNHLGSLSLLGQKTCPVLFFLCLSMAKVRGRQRSLPSPKGGKTEAVLKTIRKPRQEPSASISWLDGSDRNVAPLA